MFHGSIVALITPFRNGGIDEAALQALVEWHIEQGTHGLVPVGTTGESPTLSHAEHERVVELVIEAAAGRLPVIAGAGSNSTAEAISLARHAKQVGADAILVVTPYYNKPTQDGLYAHFKAIHDAVDLPLIIYNIPGPLGGRHERRHHGRARPAAERGRRQGRHLRSRAAAADHARLRRGLLPAVRRGHHRARVPRQWRRRLHLGHRERRAAPVRRDARGLAARRCQGALAIHLRLTPLHRALFLETSPAPVKYAVARLGKCAPDVRLPLVAPKEATRRRSTPRWSRPA